MTRADTSPDIDTYLAGFEGETRRRLERIRAIVREEAPEAVEVISYAMPTFDLAGRHLVHFAGYGGHVGLYPMPSGITAFAEELDRYTSGKGSVRFPHGEPLPEDLIRRIVRFRVAEVADGERIGHGALPAGDEGPEADDPSPSRTRVTEMLPADEPGAIERAARVLLDGGLVAFSTETVYGLGALGLDAEMAASIFLAKGRPRFDPLILHVANARQVETVAHMNEAAWRLAERFWPGPLTLVVPRTADVPDIVTSGLSTVAVRVPAHPVAHSLLEAVGQPVAAPSANPFGRLSPTTAAHVMAGLSGRIDLVIDGGPTSRGLESTIVSVAEGAPVLLRTGSIAAEEIEELLGMRVERRTSSSRPASPGQLESHYAPRTPLIISEGPAKQPGRAGLVTLGREEEDGGWAAVEVLSASGDLTEAATHLFAALHRLDALGLDVIVFRPVPAVGLGAAIMDRVRRAAVETAIPGASDDE